MKAMLRRLDALEVTKKPVLSPRAKRWLGLSITADEEARLEAEPEPEIDWDAVDMSNWSQETKRWFGQD